MKISVAGAQAVEQACKQVRRPMHVFLNSLQLEWSQIYDTSKTPPSNLCLIEKAIRVFVFSFLFQVCWSINSMPWKQNWISVYRLRIEMEKGEFREGKSLDETPTWAVATVVTFMVSFGFLVHHSLKKFGEVKTMSPVLFFILWSLMNLKPSSLQVWLFLMYLHLNLFSIYSGWTRLSGNLC